MIRTLALAVAVAFAPLAPAHARGFYLPLPVEVIDSTANLNLVANLTMAQEALNQALQIRSLLENGLEGLGAHALGGLLSQALPGSPWLARSIEHYVHTGDLDWRYLASGALHYAAPLSTQMGLHPQAWNLASAAIVTGSLDIRQIAYLSGIESTIAHTLGDLPHTGEIAALGAQIALAGEIDTDRLLKRAAVQALARTDTEGRLSPLIRAVASGSLEEGPLGAWSAEGAFAAATEARLIDPAALTLEERNTVMRVLDATTGGDPAPFLIASARDEALARAAARNAGEAELEQIRIAWEDGEQTIHHVVNTTDAPTSELFAGRSLAHDLREAHTYATAEGVGSGHRNLVERSVLRRTAATHGDAVARARMLPPGVVAHGPLALRTGPLQATPPPAAPPFVDLSTWGASPDNVLRTHTPHALSTRTLDDLVAPRTEDPAEQSFESLRLRRPYALAPEGLIDSAGDIEHALGALGPDTERRMRDDGATDASKGAARSVPTDAEIARNNAGAGRELARDTERLIADVALDADRAREALSETVEIARDVLAWQDAVDAGVAATQVLDRLASSADAPLAQAATLWPATRAGVTTARAHDPDPDLTQTLHTTTGRLGAAPTLVAELDAHTEDFARITEGTVLMSHDPGWRERERDIARTRYAEAAVGCAPEAEPERPRTLSRHFGSGESEPLIARLVIDPLSDVHQSRNGAERYLVHHEIPRLRKEHHLAASHVALLASLRAREAASHADGEIEASMHRLNACDGLICLWRVVADLERSRIAQARARAELELFSIRATEAQAFTLLPIELTEDTLHPPSTGH